MQYHSSFLKRLKEVAKANYKMKSFLVLILTDWMPVENKKNVMAKHMQPLVQANLVCGNVKMAMTMTLKFKYQATGILNEKQHRKAVGDKRMLSKV